MQVLNYLNKVFDINTICIEDVVESSEELNAK